MTSVLEEKLRTVFSPEQAHLLAEVIREAYDDLVKAKDFNELKAIEFCDRDTLPLRNGEYEFDLVFAIAVP